MGDRTHRRPGSDHIRFSGRNAQFLCNDGPNGLVAALSLAQPHAGPKEALDFIHRVHASVDRPANFASCDLFTAANNDIIIGTRLKFSQMIGLIRNGTHRIIFPPQMRFRYHLALPLSLAKNRAFPVMVGRHLHRQDRGAVIGSRNFHIHYLGRTDRACRFGPMRCPFLPLPAAGGIRKAAKRPRILAPSPRLQGK